MIVVDTSAVIGALAGQPRVTRLVDRVINDRDLHAPHLIDVEFQHALRRLVVAGAINDDRAADARMGYANLTIVRHPHVSLADRTLAEALTAQRDALGIHRDGPMASAIGPRLPWVPGLDPKMPEWTPDTSSSSKPPGTRPCWSAWAVDSRSS